MNIIILLMFLLVVDNLIYILNIPEFKGKINCNYLGIVKKVSQKSATYFRRQPISVGNLFLLLQIPLLQIPLLQIPLLKIPLLQIPLHIYRFV
jgi:hypothetical protein